MSQLKNQLPIYTTFITHNCIDPKRDIKSN